MIAGLVEILLFQGLGELLSRLLLPTLPGPVIGLVLLIAFLALRGSVPPPLAEVAGAFGRHLGLLFVPAAVGVVMFIPQLRQHAFAVLAALLISVVLTIAVTGLILRLTESADGDDV